MIKGFKNAGRALSEIRKEKQNSKLEAIYIHRLTKKGTPSKTGTLFGSESYHAKTPELECKRLEELNPGTKWIIIKY